jgi:hypothetical protein
MRKAIRLKTARRKAPPIRRPPKKPAAPESKPTDKR